MTNKNLFYLIFIGTLLMPWGDGALADGMAAKSYVDSKLSLKLDSNQLAGIISEAIAGKEDVSNKIKSVSGGGGRHWHSI